MSLEESMPRIGIRLGIATLVLVFAWSLVPGGASGAALYEQMGGTPGGLVASEQSIVANSNDCLQPLFSPIDEQDCIAADDFTVPAGPAWSISGIQAEGEGGAGDDFKFEFFRDVGGLPFSPSSARLGTGEVRGPASGSGDVAFRSKKWSRGLAALPPGNYWLAVYADGLQNESSATSWYWRAQSPQVGREAVWGLMCGETAEVWSYLSACGQTGPDLRFRLEGERMTRSFSKFQLSRPRPKHNGGFTAYGTFPGPGEVTVAGAGASQTTVEARRRPIVKDAPVPIQINPTPGTKRALKGGAMVKARVAIRYVRFAGIDRKGPPFTRTLTLVLDKP